MRLVELSLAVANGFLVVEKWGAVTRLIVVVACWVFWREAEIRRKYLEVDSSEDKLTALQRYLGFPLSKEARQELVDARWQRA